MNRRKLFSFLPLAPALAAAAVVTESQAEEKPEDSMFHTLRLNTSNKSINLSVGRDGNLWIKSDTSDWKRVVTE